MTAVDIYCGNIPRIDVYNKCRVIRDPSHITLTTIHSEQLPPSDSEIYNVSEIQRVSLAGLMEHERPDVWVANLMKLKKRQKRAIKFMLMVNGM